MMFPDFPYHELEESYVHSEEVIKYLKNYLIHHDLNQYIKVNLCTLTYSFVK